MGNSCAYHLQIIRKSYAKHMQLYASNLQVMFQSYLSHVEVDSKGEDAYLETVDENLWLGPKLTIDKKATILAIFLWNLAIIAYSRGGRIEQVS